MKTPEEMSMPRRVLRGKKSEMQEVRKAEWIRGSSKATPLSSNGSQFLALPSLTSYSQRPVFPPLEGGSASLALSG